MVLGLNPDIEYMNPTVDAGYTGSCRPAQQPMRWVVKTASRGNCWLASNYLAVLAAIFRTMVSTRLRSLLFRTEE